MKKISYESKHQRKKDEKRKLAQKKRRKWEVKFFYTFVHKCWDKRGNQKQNEKSA